MDGTHDSDRLLTLVGQLELILRFFNDLLIDHVFKGMVKHELRRPGDLASISADSRPFLSSTSTICFLFTLAVM